MILTDKQKSIAKVYADLIKKTGKAPSRSKLKLSGISRDVIRHHFGTMNGLKIASSELFPDVFEKLKKSPHPLAGFTKESLGTIVKENNYQDGMFIITAVAPVTNLDYTADQLIAAKDGKDVVGENLHKPAFNAVKNFMDRNSAQLVLLPMPAHMKSLHEQPLHYDPSLEEYQSSFATEFTFNKHLKAIEAHINPQQTNPLTGLKRLRIHKYLGSDGAPGEEIKRFKTSIVVAHSKQMLEVVPTGNNTAPRIIHSTGAITKPAYLRNRIGMIANEDHKLGALVVEIEGDIFHIRQVQMDPKNGSFVDLGKRYHADGTVTEERAEAFKMGDVHPGHHSQKALDAIYDLWSIIKPKRIFFEDFFDGSSISHHLEKKKISQAKLPDCFSSLEKEINMAKGVLGEIYKKAPKDAELIATASNHPEHVMRYLDEGRYINDKVNFDIAHRMVVMALDGKNPLKEYLDPKGQMRWTDENEDYFVEGVQMNTHGHLGINGMRGSKQGHELAHGNAMIAHSHTPSIFHDTFTVGHSTEPRHGYNNGPSTWVLCSGAIYKGGQKQLYMIIKGRFRAEKKPKFKKRK